METPVINNGKLFARIVAVMAAIRSLPKDGFNSQGNYNYVSSNTALEHIGKEMAANGLAIIPMLIESETRDEPKGNSTRTRTRCKFQMHICDVDGNAFIAPWEAEGIDYGNPDKALNKAMTNATKYFLLKLFILGAGDDDPDAESDTSQAAQKPKQGAKPAQNAKPAATASAGAKPSREMLQQLDTLGEKLYGDAWGVKRQEFAYKASKGATMLSGELTAEQVGTLITGISKKLGETAKAPAPNGKPQPQPA